MARAPEASKTLLVARIDALNLHGEIVFNETGTCLIKISTEQVRCKIQRIPLKKLNAILALIDSSEYIEMLRRFSDKKLYGDKAIQIFQDYLTKSPTTGIFAGFESIDLEDVTNTETIPSSDSNEAIEVVSYPGKVSKL